MVNCESFGLFQLLKREFYLARDYWPMRRNVYNCPKIQMMEIFHRIINPASTPPSPGATEGNTNNYHQPHHTFNYTAILSIKTKIQCNDDYS